MCVVTHSFVETDTVRSRPALSLNENKTTPLPFYRMRASRLGPVGTPPLETYAAETMTVTAQLPRSTVPGYPTSSMPTDNSSSKAGVPSTPRWAREQTGIRSSTLPQPLTRYLSMK